MTAPIQKLSIILGRLCLAAIFVYSGIHKFMDLSGTATTLAKVGFPIPLLFAVGAATFEVVGALSLATGLQTRIGACLLIIFLIPTTFIFHPPGSQLIQFLKNLGILGGLLIIVASGEKKLGQGQK